MSENLFRVLNCLLERLVLIKSYEEASEIGLYLLYKGRLLESNLKWLMVAVIKKGRREELLEALLEKEKKSGLSTLDKGIVASIFYQLKNEERCIEYALQYSKDRTISIGKSGVVKVLILQTFASGAFNFNAKTRRFHMPEGHNNLMSVLDKNIQKIILRVDDLELALKKINNINVDVIYNAITDPERCEAALYKAAAVCDMLSGVPVINHPHAVLLSTRDNNYHKFNCFNNIIYPKNIKISNVNGGCRSLIFEAVSAHQLKFPLIVRLSGYQVGKNMHLMEYINQHDFSDFDALTKQSEKDIYIIEYVDVSFQDKRLSNKKLYPKYRAFMVGGKLYPIHLFISDSSFNVHYHNSKKIMADNAWLQEMGERYCSYPEDIIGTDNWRTLEKIMQQTGLDYVGVDFAISQDIDHPKVVIFEINAAMRNSMNSDSMPSYIRECWKNVTLHVHQLLCMKANVSEWDFDFLLK
ncbi:ATP-grasp domain-containing protein [Thiopseudomonas alkaliphila]|uniref:ATP-grasp domain-containing protein n=1 Tax=Thiopseudomonas alkaliphila TaxID=1697053 RepID=UPI00257787F5|nr:hypothetical protein [Thiopseudomonas alkaliphila]MDM1716467.1 hypothetical protein [Thiopseudomonas alkaliphila]